MFLTRHCGKPAGVEIVIDDVVPRAAASGVLSRRLAIKHMDGPPDHDTAYLYYLFFDSAISPDKKSQPVCLLTPYPGAILVDHQYVKARIRRQRVFRTRVLLHETGHALGLCRVSDHSDGLHCTNKGCLMNASLHLSVLRVIFGGDVVKQKEFCGDCLRDLTAEQREPPPDHLGYIGPWFVRSEDGYHVITRPNMMHVQIGPLDELNEQSLDDLRETALTKTNKRIGTSYSFTATNRDAAVNALKALREDPSGAVRKIAEDLAQELRHQGRTDSSPK